jgi:hypothetical protein
MMPIMNIKKIKLFAGAACGAVALMNLGLQAQTLPITAGLQLWLNADIGVTTNASAGPHGPTNPAWLTTPPQPPRPAPRRSLSIL